MKPSLDDVVATTPATLPRTAGEPGADALPRPAPLAEPARLDPGLVFSLKTHSAPSGSRSPGIGGGRQFLVRDWSRPGTIPSPLNEYF